MIDPEFIVRQAYVTLGAASGLLGRDDAKDNVFAQLVVRY